MKILPKCECGRDINPAKLLGQQRFKSKKDSQKQVELMNKKRIELLKQAKK